MDRYTTEVQTRFQMDVPEFESDVKKELLQQKFQQLVTDGITVSDDEVQAEFRRENEKIKIDYVRDQAGRSASQNRSVRRRPGGLLREE